MTRARERLLLMHARHRAFYGSVTDQRPSRFLQELPNEHLARHELTHQLHDLPAYFALWISGAGSIKTVAAKQTPTKNPVAHAQKELERILAASPFGKNKKWQYKQKISHQKFGIGIIEQIDERDIRKTILTIRFDTGTKKIDSKFIDTL
jgi:DNA helicase-2/ATP-dependent DNA helicase PcrA